MPPRDISIRELETMDDMAIAENELIIPQEEVLDIPNVNIVVPSVPQRPDLPIEHPDYMEANLNYVESYINCVQAQYDFRLERGDFAASNHDRQRIFDAAVDAATTERIDRNIRMFVQLGHIMNDVFIFYRGANVGPHSNTAERDRIYDLLLRASQITDTIHTVLDHIYDR